jgi:hypothetical protein
MSTRSQIKLKNSSDNIHIYKHWDGYPEDVLPVLVPFVQDFMASRGYDECYMLAQIVRAFAVADHKYNEEQAKKKNPELFSGDDKSPYRFLGWGLDLEHHGDIEYLYEIDENGAIFVNGKKLTTAQIRKYTKQGG